MPATTLNLLAGAWIQFEVHDWFSHGKSDAEQPVGRSRSTTTTPGPSTRCRSRARAATRARADDGPPTFVTDDTHWWDGSQIYGRDIAFADGLRTRRAREAADRRARAAAAGARGARRPHRRRGQLLGRARAAALALHARAQRDLRPPARSASRAVGRRALRQGAARRRRADGEDPHGRLDAGDHRAPDDRARAAHELVGPRGRAARQAHRPADVERGDPRHPRLADRPPRRPVLADRGVRRGLPHAPADSGRVQLPLARRRRRRSQERTLPELGAVHVRERLGEISMRRPLLLVRHVAPGRDHAAQLSRASCSTSSGPTDRSSTSPRSTSCAPASAACRATTSSGGCST